MTVKPNRTNLASFPSLQARTNNSDTFEGTHEVELIALWKILNSLKQDVLIFHYDIPKNLSLIYDGTYFLVFFVCGEIKL